MGKRTRSDSNGFVIIATVFILFLLVIMSLAGVMVFQNQAFDSAQAVMTSQLHSETLGVSEILRRMLYVPGDVDLYTTINGLGPAFQITVNGHVFNINFNLNHSNQNRDWALVRVDGAIGQAGQELARRSFTAQYLRSPRAYKFVLFRSGPGFDGVDIPQDLSFEDNDGSDSTQFRYQIRGDIYNHSGDVDGLQSCGNGRVCHEFGNIFRAANLDPELNFPELATPLPFEQQMDAFDIAIAGQTNPVPCQNNGNNSVFTLPLNIDLSDTNLYPGNTLVVPACSARVQPNAQTTITGTGRIIALGNIELHSSNTVCDGTLLDFTGSDLLVQPAGGEIAIMAGGVVSANAACHGFTRPINDTNVVEFDGMGARIVVYSQGNVWIPDADNPGAFIPNGQDQIDVSGFLGRCENNVVNGNSHIEAQECGIIMDNTQILAREDIGIDQGFLISGVPPRIQEQVRHSLTRTLLFSQGLPQTDGTRVSGITLRAVRFSGMVISRGWVRMLRTIGNAVQEYAHVRGLVYSSMDGSIPGQGTQFDRAQVVGAALVRFIDGGLINDSSFMRFPRQTDGGGFNPIPGGILNNWYDMSPITEHVDTGLFEAGDTTVFMVPGTFRWQDSVGCNAPCGPDQTCVDGVCRDFCTAIDYVDSTCNPGRPQQACFYGVCEPT